MSSQNRVDPFQIRLESGLGGRWPIRWRPGTSVEGGTRFWPSGFRVYPILAIALYILYHKVTLRDVFKEIPGVTQFENGRAGNTAVATAHLSWVKHCHRSSSAGVRADYYYYKYLI